MKEWEFDEAVDVVYDILMDTVPEHNLSNEECEKLAKAIITALNDPAP